MNALDDGDGVPELLLRTSEFTGLRWEATIHATTPPQSGPVWISQAQVATVTPIPGEMGAVASLSFYESDPVARFRDLDGDGDADLTAYYRSSTAFGPCVGYDLGREDRPSDEWDWRFHRGDPNEEARGCVYGDVNGDGYVDVAAHYLNGRHQPTSAYISYGPFVPGEVNVASNAAGTTGWLDVGAVDMLIGDFNGDGASDLCFPFIAGAADRYAEVHFGPFGTTLDLSTPDLLIQGTAGRSSFGFAATVGDVDGDGTDDLLFTTYDHPTITPQGGGAALLFKGPLQPGVLEDADADSIISWPHAGARAGTDILAVGDVNGDGLSDFAVAARASRFLTTTYDTTPVWPPPDTGLETGWFPDTGTPAAQGRGIEGAYMFFSNPPDGQLGPEDALFTIMGAHPWENVGWNFATRTGDLDGDGMDDFAYVAEGEPHEIRIVHPCADFGTPVP